MQWLQLALMAFAKAQAFNDLKERGRNAGQAVVLLLIAALLGIVAIEFLFAALLIAIAPQLGFANAALLVGGGVVLLALIPGIIGWQRFSRAAGQKAGGLSRKLNIDRGLVVPGRQIADFKSVSNFVTRNQTEILAASTILGMLFGRPRRRTR